MKRAVLSIIMSTFIIGISACSSQEGSAVMSSNALAEVEIPEPEDNSNAGLSSSDTGNIGEGNTNEEGYGVTGSDVTDEETDDTTIEEGETSGTIIFNGRELETVGDPNADWHRMSQEEAQAVLDAGSPNMSDILEQYGYNDAGVEAYAEAWSQYYGAMCETGQIDWGDGSIIGGKWYYDPYESAKADAKVQYENYVSDMERVGWEIGTEEEHQTVRLEDGTEVSVEEYLNMMGY